MKQWTKRASARAARKASWAAGQRPTGSSRYARKAQWLAKHNLFGFQVPSPKPWQ